MHPFALARFKLKTNCYNIDWSFFRNINFLMVKKYYIVNKKSFLEIGIIMHYFYFHTVYEISKHCLGSDDQAMHPGEKSSWSVQLHNLNSMTTCLYKPSNKHLIYFP